MRTDEIVIRMINQLDEMYGETIDQVKVKEMMEGVLYDFDITPKTTALALVNNMQDRMMLYLQIKQLEGLAKSSINAYGRCLKRFSEELTVNVEDVTTMDIRRYLVMYSQTGVKDTTIANTTDILRGFFSWLETEEYIERDPMRKIKTIKAQSEVREPLTYEELELLRGGCKTLRQKALLEFAYATCARLEEIVNVKISDIDWMNMQLKVVGKGSKERIVYINSRAKIYMEQYLKSRDDNCDSLIVTARKPIKRMEGRTIQDEINKIQQQSKLDKNIHPHILRHSGASHMLSKGIDINIIKEILGHDSVATTELYAKTSNTSVSHEYKKYMNS